MAGSVLWHPSVRNALLEVLPVATSRIAGLRVRARTHHQERAGSKEAELACSRLERATLRVVDGHRQPCKHGAQRIVGIVAGTVAARTAAFAEVAAASHAAVEPVDVRAHMNRSVPFPPPLHADLGCACVAASVCDKMRFSILDSGMSTH
jgi:hypothetical protein